MSERAEEAGAPSEAAARALELLHDLLGRMRLRTKVSVTEHEERIELQISGQDAGLAVGKKGQTLDALQYLTNRIMSRQGQEKMVVIDSEGYRERREASLVEMAQRLGEKAQHERKIVALNPMSARDRRIIHITLRDTPGVSTRSEGQGELRRLLIVPESHAV